VALVKLHRRLQSIRVSEVTLTTTQCMASSCNIDVRHP